VEKDGHTHQRNEEDAVDHSRGSKLIKDIGQCALAIRIGTVWVNIFSDTSSPGLSCLKGCLTFLTICSNVLPDLCTF